MALMRATDWTRRQPWRGLTCFPDDREHVDATLDRLPDAFHPWIANDYERQFQQGGRRAANQRMLGIRKAVGHASVRRAASEDDIRDRARAKARQSFRLARGGRDGVARAAIEARIVEPEAVGPAGAETDRGAVLRYQCPQWWSRRLRVRDGQQVESVAVSLGIVSQQGQSYASDASVERRRQQKARNRSALEEIEAVNELGETFSLADLAEHSVANPALRRNELMVRIAGCEAYADRHGHVAAFYTLTCPGRMHAQGGQNPRYDGTTPRQAQHYLRDLWARARSALHRRGVRPYGVRVAEPHQDGCPHWHLLLFMAPAEQATVREVLRAYALTDAPDEPGAEQHRFRVEAIDRNRGTAAGYVAKYVSKAIDGHGLKTDLHGHDAQTAAERVNAWASTWRIRQFQFIGLPAVTIWRELRRLRESVDGALEQARQAADTGQWDQFMAAMDDTPIQLVRRDVVDRGTGEIQLGRYGEPLTGRIYGVACDGVTYPTRFHQWQIQKTKGANPCTASNSANTAPAAATKPDPDNLLPPGDPRRRAARAVDWRPWIRATVTAYGQSLSGIPKGTVLGWEEAKKLPAAEDERIAHWVLSARLAGVSPPWSSVNNCTRVVLGGGTSTDYRVKIKSASPGPANLFRYPVLVTIDNLPQSIRAERKYVVTTFNTYVTAPSLMGHGRRGSGT